MIQFDLPLTVLRTHCMRSVDPSSLFFHAVVLNNKHEDTNSRRDRRTSDPHSRVSRLPVVGHHLLTPENTIRLIRSRNDEEMLTTHFLTVDIPRQSHSRKETVQRPCCGDAAACPGFRSLDRSHIAIFGENNYAAECGVVGINHDITTFVFLVYHGTRLPSGSLRREWRRDHAAVW